VRLLSHNVDMTTDTPSNTTDTWVVCLCADWCGTCKTYRSDFDALQSQHTAGHFAWVDIEDRADWLGDLDVEDFPTLLIFSVDQSCPSAAPVIHFFGTVLPHIGHLERLLQSYQDEAAKPDAALQTSDLQALCGHIVRDQSC
jgi:thioredoxin 1